MLSHYFYYYLPSLDPSLGLAGAAGDAAPLEAVFGAPEPAVPSVEASWAAFLSAGVWPENCLVGENSPNLCHDQYGKDHL